MYFQSITAFSYPLKALKKFIWCSVQNFLHFYFVPYGCKKSVKPQKEIKVSFKITKTGGRVQKKT